jgi:sporulation protein YlmC with PRC-barrel domain
MSWEWMKKINENVSETVNTADSSNQIGLSMNEESNQLINDMELTTKNWMDDELEKRFQKVSMDFEDLDKNFKEDGEYTNKKINKREDIIQLNQKQDYGGMRVMKIKEEIIGKEVVDVNGMVIGKVKDVDVGFKTKTLETFIVGKGGILEGLGSSKGDIIVPDSMVIAIGDKILVKSEKQVE